MSQNLLPNCPITVDDITAADNIFGTDIGALKGKIPRIAPNRIRPINMTVSPALKYGNYGYGPYQSRPVI